MQKIKKRESPLDFGYAGQKYSRSSRYPVWSRYPVFRLPDVVMFPFAMELMVEEGMIEPEQVVRFMSMLEGDDREIEKLACIILTQLCNELKNKRLKYDR